MQQAANDVDEVKRSLSLSLTAFTSRGLNILIGKQLRQELWKWLSPPDPSTNHNIARNSHHEGTATWFFQWSIFEEWKSNPSLLWIHGKGTLFLLPYRCTIHSFLSLQLAPERASCGLLFLKPPLPRLMRSISSAVIEQIRTLCDAGLASMAYFYFDFRDKDKKNHRNLLLSLLLQLSAQSDICCSILSNLHSDHRDGTETASDAALTKCLKAMLSFTSQHPTYLVMDALDECPNNSGLPSPREQVLQLVKDLVDLCLPNLHICVTSRPEVDIRVKLEPLTSLRVSIHEQSGQKKDIVDYVTSVVYSDANMQRWREEDKDKRLVVETLSERADGM
jgi:hypothetical protein